MRKVNLLLMGLFVIAAFTSCDDKRDPALKPEAIKTIMNKTAEWQINHPRHAQNNWTNGAFYAGLFAAWETTQSPIIYNAMMAMGEDSTQWQPASRWYHADDIAISQTYIDLYRI